MHFFHKAQMEKLFFLFPDPHFKVSNHRRRIIQRGLLAEYGYVMKEGGLLYTLTDVAELGTWMADRLAACPLFERLSPEEEAADPCVPLLMASEEAQKVGRRGKGGGGRMVVRKGELWPSVATHAAPLLLLRCTSLSLEVAAFRDVAPL